MFQNEPDKLRPGGQISASQFNDFFDQVESDLKALRQSSEGFQGGPLAVNNDLIRLGYNPVRVYTDTLGTAGFTLIDDKLISKGTVVGSQKLYAALSPIDGVTLKLGDRILYNPNSTLCDRDAGNLFAGIYELVQEAATYSPWVLRRTFDARRDSDFKSGYLVMVQEGDRHRGQLWRLATLDTITLNTTPLLWVPVPTRFKAKITARRTETCAASGSGSGSVAGNTVYVYDFWQTERELASNDCPQWGLL